MLWLYSSVNKNLSNRIVITLLSLLCKLSYRMQFLPSFLNGGGAKNFLSRWGLNNCCNAGGCWGKWVLIFSGTPFFQRNLNLMKSKNISHTLCNHNVYTKTVCTKHASLILWMFVKMTFTSLFLPTLVIIPNLLSLCTCPSKK